MAGSLPRLPQRLMVRGETRKREATSRTVRRSGRLVSSSSEAGLRLVVGASDDII